MTRQGKYKEALDRFIWFNAQKDTEMAGVRRSFGLAYWEELGEVYPPAMAALVKNRDDKTQKIIAEGNSKDDFADVVALNKTLKENNKSIDLFEIVSRKYPILAKDACYYVLDNLIESKRYDLIQTNVVNPVDQYKIIESKYSKAFQDIGNSDKSLKEYTEDSFVEKSLALIQYCLAINDNKSANEIQSQSFRIVPDKRILHALLTDK